MCAVWNLQPIIDTAAEPAAAGTWDSAEVGQDTSAADQAEEAPESKKEEEGSLSGQLQAAVERLKSRSSTSPSPEPTTDEPSDKIKTQQQDKQERPTGEHLAQATLLLHWFLFGCIPFNRWTGRSHCEEEEDAGECWSTLFLQQGCRGPE